MSIENTMTQAPAATYVHETLSEEAFESIIDGLPLTTFGELLYSHVEYINSPHGLIVLAHQGDIAGQVDGIHPASISQSVERPNNIVEQLTSYDGKVFSRDPVAYNSHWIGRKSQGSLVKAACGRMIDGGDPEAPRFEAPDGEGFTMTIYDGPHGPVVGIFDYNADVVHVVRPATSTTEAA